MRVARRIRYRYQGNQLIAEVEERSGMLGKWHPTGVREVIDLTRTAQVVRLMDRASGNTAGEADTAGFWSRVKKVGKKIAKSKVVKVVVKAHTAPLKVAHKITHGKNSPIRKAEEAVKKAVTKALPITKPFVAVHEKVSGATHNALGKVTGDKSSKPNPKDVADLVETNKRIKAKAISNAVKKAPKAQRDAVREHLIKAHTSWQVTSPTTGLTYSFKL